MRAGNSETERLAAKVYFVTDCGFSYFLTHFGNENFACVWETCSENDLRNSEGSEFDALVVERSSNLTQGKFSGKASSLVGEFWIWGYLQIFWKVVLVSSF